MDPSVAGLRGAGAGKAREIGRRVETVRPNRDVLVITIQNNGQQPLVLPYRVTPLEHFVVELRGENGKKYKIEHTGQKVDKAELGVLTIPAGQSKTLSVHTCHSLPELGELDQKITVIARLKHAGRFIESKPLTHDP